MFGRSHTVPDSKHRGAIDNHDRCKVHVVERVPHTDIVMRNAAVVPAEFPNAVCVFNYGHIVALPLVVVFRTDDKRG